MRGDRQDQVDDQEDDLPPLGGAEGQVRARTLLRHGDREVHRDLGRQAREGGAAHSKGYGGGDLHQALGEADHQMAMAAVCTPCQAR